MAAVAENLKDNKLVPPSRRIYVHHSPEGANETTAMEICSSLLEEIHEDSDYIQHLRTATYTNITSIDYIKEPVTYEEFFQGYLLPNRPCVLGRWATEGWLSRCDWVTDAGSINHEFLKENFGESKAPVADCNKEEYSAHPKEDTTVSDYLHYMQTRQCEGQDMDRCLYLKDWHFQREFPSYKAYTTPVYFRSDWLNEFWDTRDDVTDDYRFVYIGVKGSWTPFHADVFRSYSWSANIIGHKRWIMFPPGEEKHLCDKFGQLAFDLNSPDLKDRNKFPDADKVTKRFEVEQKAGEVIFVPSGWHHQVLNVEDTISINHNWLNGCNVDVCWRYLVSGLGDVQKEISDCRDMDGWGQQCQVILRANLGIDYAEFFRFMYNIAETRLCALQSEIRTSVNSCECTSMTKQCESPTKFDKNQTESPTKNCDNKDCTFCECKSQGRKQFDEESPTKSDINLTSFHEETSTDPENSCDAHPSSRQDGLVQHSLCAVCNKTRVELISPPNEHINHILFDLIQIKKVICAMKTNKDFLETDLDVLPLRPKKLIQNIDIVLKEFGIS